MSSQTTGNSPGAGNGQANEQVDAALIRPVTAGWVKMDGKYDDGETFIPIPQLTFLIDNPGNLECRLCRVSQLRVSPDALAEVTDETPALMLCGYIAGAVCLAATLDSADPGERNCPFCRIPLDYSGCGHRILPKVLTANAIGTVPATVPNGGVVPESCPDCRAAESQMEALSVIADTKMDIIDAKVNYDLNPTDEGARAIVEFTELFRQQMADETTETARISSGIGSW